MGAGENQIVDKNLSAKTFFTTLQEVANEQCLSMAFWRLPQGNEKKIILSSKVSPFNIVNPIEELQPGFIFYPYDKKKDGHFIEAEFCFTVKDSELVPPLTEVENISHTWLAEYKPKVANSKIKIPANPIPIKEKAKDDYIKLVETCMAEISKGAIEKIVPSRFRQIKIENDFDVIEKFHALCDQFPNALVSLDYILDVGCWLGASPELLVSVDHQSIFRTVALAGTQRFESGTNIKSIAWTQKEIEEQALVERYIISCFKKIRLREYDEHGPKTVIAGNLVHLKSEFVVDLKETHFQQLGTVMLQLLHPTSAVCGMPHDLAQNVLDREEGYDRSYYAGFLGPVNIDSSITLHVNLRCMNVAYPYATLYAGAGVTSDSIPEKEWEETEIKLDTLNHILL